MVKVIAEITTSLDGYVAGPNDGPELGLGVGGEQLHEWVYGLASWREPHGLEGGETNVDSELLEESVNSSGAIVVGRRMFDNARGWGDEPPFRKPVFVLTHERRDPEEKAGTTFTFVEGVARAIELARQAAGERNVAIGGGASTIRQALEAGLVDELELHVAPLLLGGGIRLFETLEGAPPGLERIRVVDSPAVTHLRYRVRR